MTDSSWDTGSRLAERIAGVIRYLVIGVLGLMTVLIFANVVLRYAVGSSLPWAEETARYLMIWLTFLSSGVVMRQGGHICIDYLNRKLPERVARWFNLFNLALILVCCAVLSYYGVRYAWMTQVQVTPTLRIPFGLVYLGIPLGMGLMATLIVLDFGRLLRGNWFPDPDASADEPLPGRAQP
ncbi:TRAP transporter small permease [Pseudomonas sp.]|uniref:TRAP transporter small permease n=1 Tax=Pseudomonas sp. TaxID=306 RepID=UPI0026316534|nr:TRAP transporter small permease [Pseudomonas sp.]